MSIPWPECSHRQLVQLTTAAGFLSPAAVVVLAKATCSFLTSCGLQVRESQLPSVSNHSYDSETCCETKVQTASEPDILEEGAGIQQNICQGFQESTDAAYRGAVDSSDYCTCSTTDNCLVTQSHAGLAAVASSEYCICSSSNSRTTAQSQTEGRNWAQLRQMEVSDPERPTRDQVEARAAKDYIKLSERIESQRALKSYTSQTTDTGCPKEQESQRALKSYKSQAIDTGCPKEQSDQLTNAYKTDLESASRKKQENTMSFHLRQDSMPAYNINGQGVNAPDTQALHEKDKYTKTTMFASHVPQIQEVTLDEVPVESYPAIYSQQHMEQEPNSQTKTTSQITPEKNLTKARSVEKRKGNKMDGASDGEEKPAKTPVTDAKGTGEIKGESDDRNTSEVKDSTIGRRNVRKREKSSETHHKSPDIQDKTSQGSPSQQDKIVSRSSSGDSFSTACCSSSSCSSSSESSDTGQTGSRTTQDGDDYHQPVKSEVKQTNSLRAVPEMSADSKKEPPPLFEFGTSPRLFSASRDGQNESSKQTGLQKDNNLRDTRSSDDPNKSSDMNNKRNLSGWLKSLLKGWLPLYSRKPPGAVSGPRPATKCSSENFHEYDVRNIINPEPKRLWGSEQPPGYNSCPHSCASSFCNFRQTLEGLKKELLALHEAMEHSPSAIQANPCLFCHKTHDCQGLAECRTVNIAQELWRMVIQFKLSHLQPCDCPRMSQRKLGGRKLNSDYKEAQQCPEGHWHSCQNDFLGCSQQRNNPTINVISEAPCVHVLLDEVDLLQRKLQNGNVGQSLQGIGELEELNDFFLGGGKQSPLSASRRYQSSGQVCDQETIGRPRTLGKFALRYLEHIENSMDTSSSRSRSPSPTRTRGESPKRVPSVNIIPQSHSSENVSIPETVVEDPPDQQSKREPERVDEVHNTVQAARFDEELNNINLKSAFDSIIADLIQFQQNQSRHNMKTIPDILSVGKSPKNVKFSPSSTRRAEALTGNPTPGTKSPAQQCMAPTISSCSLAANEECLKDVNVHQAFDQLDKIVDELLILMDGSVEPCTK